MKNWLSSNPGHTAFRDVGSFTPSFLSTVSWIRGFVAWRHKLLWLVRQNWISDLIRFGELAATLLRLVRLKRLQQNFWVLSWWTVRQVDKPGGRDRVSGFWTMDRTRLLTSTLCRQHLSRSRLEDSNEMEMLEQSGITIVVRVPASLLPTVFSSADWAELPERRFFLFLPIEGKIVLSTWTAVVRLESVGGRS